MSPATTKSRKSTINPISEVGNIKDTCSLVIFSPPKDSTWPNKPSASRMQPSDLAAIILKTSSSIFAFSAWAIFFNLLIVSAAPTFLKSNRWQREIIVSGTLWISVVQRIKIIRAGGSSKVLSRALNAEIESICTSSMINILNFALLGENLTFSIMFSLTLSTPVWDAASISIISRHRPSLIFKQAEHWLHGSNSPFFLRSQLTALANNLAVVVLPNPLGPQNK